jgi:cysteinyl-tRNA synthetase
MKIYNTLSREIEDFRPINNQRITMYACGPTVYDYQHIGNLRTATLMDTLKRALKYLDYNVYAVMNITDVEDKIERKARETNSKVSDITKKFEDIYKEHLGLMNISADFYPHATDHISEMIEIIKVLLEKEIAYQNEYGLYFDISKDPDYGKLGNTFKSNKERPRIEITEGKRNPEDFALWKFPVKDEERQMLWESPWGKGFPGWHIECSAMSMKYLSEAFADSHLNKEAFETLDIHIGGSDLKDVHHENEIAQTESATDKQFVKYWVHGAMLSIKGDKMSKSLNNYITLQTVIEKGFEPIVLRYFYYTAHYRKEQSFTWEALEGAKNAYNNLLKDLKSLNIAAEKSLVNNDYKIKFKNALEDDLNLPQILSLVWEILKSDLEDNEKLSTILDFDKVLGLRLEENMNREEKKIDEKLKEEIENLISQRKVARENKDFAKADEVKNRLSELNVEVMDTADETQWRVRL